MIKNKRSLWFITLCVVVLLASTVPVYAHNSGAWLNNVVSVIATAELEPYRGSYWASMLKPGYLKCNSVSLTIGNGVYIGSIYHYWWFQRKCGFTFQNIPANTQGVISVQYTANGERSYQKSVTIGKNWLGNIRRLRLFLPWSPLNP